MRRRLLPASALATLVTLASLSASLFAASPASAASSVTGCFPYQGLSTAVYSQVPSVTTYLYVPGSDAFTDPNGCVTYYVHDPDYQTVDLKIRASAAVPAWRAFLDAWPNVHATPGTGTANLGLTQMRFLLLPPRVPDPPRAAALYGSQSLTDSWMEGMNHTPARGGCQSNAAMVVACYMDRHDMFGNVVVPSRDSDEDGVPDFKDNFVFKFGLH